MVDDRAARQRVAAAAVAAGLLMALGAAPAQATTPSDGYPGSTCTTPGTLDGAAQVGQTLSASDDRAVVPTYRWWRHDPTSVDGTAWTPVADAAGARYTLTAADLGRSLEVEVRGADALGNEVCSRAESAVVVGADGAWLGTPPGPVRPFPAGAVRRPSGRAVVGGVLRARTSGLPAGTTVRYQWFRVARATARAVVGARSRTYRLRPADRATRVFVRLSLAAPGYDATTVRSRRVLVR